MRNIFIIILTALIITGCKNSKEIKQSQNNIGQNKKEETEKEFFDMKYVYKGIRADKSKFDEELKEEREHLEETKINLDFLNRKFANDDERKKYSIEFISNAYHEPIRHNGIPHLYENEYYYIVQAIEYLYVERNLALKKAREELLKLNKKDADVYLALFLSHFATDSLYRFEEIKKYLTEWKKSGGTNIVMMVLTKSYDDEDSYNERYSNNMKLINYIIEAPDSLRAEKLIYDAYKYGFLDIISKDYGYLDVHNENNYSLSEVFYSGSAYSSSIDTIENSAMYGNNNLSNNIYNADIMNKFIRTYIHNFNRKDIHYDGKESYYKNFYLMYYSYDSENELYFLEFKKNTFVYSSDYTYGIDEVLYFNPNFMGNNQYAIFEIQTNYNFRLGNIYKLPEAYKNYISENDLKDYFKNSNNNLQDYFKYSKSENFDDLIIAKYEYIDYIEDTINFTRFIGGITEEELNFFLCDINNDGKEELMVYYNHIHTGGRGGEVKFTLLLKDNLEIDLDSEIGRVINSNNDFQGHLGVQQRIYTENGKNKMFLFHKSRGNAMDIFFDNNEMKSVDYFQYMTYSRKPKLLWKGSILNGVPEGALKTDASFDMSKAENASDKAIVSDRTLRMADKLISDAYFAAKETLDKEGQEELLKKRRAEIKAIQEAKGDIKAIETEMLNILGIQ
ncbi:hypothetical protein [uncultured Brachyspira sp.]|uniref:hypothetical protein n=1 Tax=uncultured Brachyspira sp. TaxID=221953 RepID=UPI00261901CC|nr:hypothetical protein [uncultured Brachyspira sp.]